MIPSMAIVMAAQSPSSISISATVTGTRAAVGSDRRQDEEADRADARPLLITANGPQRRIIAGAASVETTPRIAPGSSWSAARVGDRPRTSCRYWVTKKAWPAKPKQVSRFPVMATRNFGTAEEADVDHRHRQLLAGGARTPSPPPAR